MNEYSSVKFPGVYYRAGRAYAFIHQHSDAVAMAKLGLEMVAMTTSSPPLYYPGTKTVIEDSKNDVIEVCKRGEDKPTYVQNTHTHTHF